MPPTTQQRETQGLEIMSSIRQETREILEETEVLSHKGDTTVKNVPGDQAKDQKEALAKNSEEKIQSTLGKPTTNISGKQPSTEIGSPIQSITHLNFSRGKSIAKVVFIGDITPISAEEMPPS
jgi:hypothetical protein